MGFQKGHKAAKGGKRPGAGRPRDVVKQALRQMLEAMTLEQIAKELGDKGLEHLPGADTRSTRDQALLTVIKAMQARDELGNVTPTSLKAATQVLGFTDEFTKETVEHRGTATDAMLVQNGNVKKFHPDAPIDEM